MNARTKEPGAVELAEAQIERLHRVIAPCLHEDLYAARAPQAVPFDREKDALWKFVKALRVEAERFDDVNVERIDSMLVDGRLAQAIDEEPWIVLNCDLGGPDDHREDR